MNSKQYIEEMKEIYKNAKEWARVQLRNYTPCEELDLIFIKELLICDSWEYAEDITNRYII